MEATSKWHKFLGLLKWSLEIVPAGLLELWTAITPDFRVRSRRGLNQSCSLRRDLSNAMSHSQIGCREEVSLTPSPSFAHNLGYRCPNDQCEAIFDIYSSRPFQWHQEHLNARRFGPCCWALNIRESRRTPNPPTLQVLGFTLTLGQSGVVTPMAGLILNLIILHKLIFNIFFRSITFYKLIHHTYGTKKVMKSEETPRASFIEQRRVFWEYPECSFPKPHFLSRFLPFMSYDLLRASLILHQAPQGSVTFPNDPWPSTNLYDLPCCSGKFRNDFCYPPYNLCKLISSVN
jgi:hypothetical protein